MEVTFAKEYSAIHRGLMHYLGFTKQMVGMTGFEPATT